MNGVGDPRRPLQGQVVEIHSLVHSINLNNSSSNFNQNNLTGQIYSIRVKQTTFLEK